MPDETPRRGGRRQSGGLWLSVAAIAGRQGRSISGGQLLDLGLSGRQVERACHVGHLVRRHRGVFGVPPVDTSGFARTWAAHLALGPASFVSHVTALAVHGIVDWEHAPVHLGVRTQRRPPDGVMVHHLSRMPPREVWKVRRLPTVAPARALLQSATLLASGRLEVAISDALTDRKVSLRKLDEVLRVSGGQHGRPALAAALASIRDDPGAGRTHGEMEALFRPLLTSLPDLPRYVRNAYLDLGAGEIVKPDVWFPDVRVWLELDSRRWHEQRRTMDADRRKDQRAVARGIAPFRLTWRHLLSEWPEVSADLVATLALRRRD